MLRQVMMSIFAAIWLAGCVLQSPEPNFTEAQGANLPKALGSRFATETFSDNAWKREEGIITLSADGKRYLASNDREKSTIDMLFVRLGASSWVMQAIEQGKPAAYVLADLDGDNLNLRPLFCEELQKQPDAVDTVRFEGSDCFLKAETSLDTFRNYGKQFGPAKARLVPAR